MDIPVVVKTDNEYEDACSEWCPMLDHWTCALFNEELQRFILPDGLAYQDEDNPLKERCWQCYKMTP